MPLRFALVALFCLASPAVAQVELAVGADARARPGGPLIAQLSPGARVTQGGTEGADLQVTFDGWVDAARLGAKRDSFPASVSGRLTLRVRATAARNGTVIAVLQPGTGLHIVSRQGTWARVRRTAWISASAVRNATAAGSGRVTAAPAPAPQPQAAPAATALSGPATPKGNAFVGSGGTRYHDLPVGRSMGGITAGSAVEIVARQNGWVRVRADGWVLEKDIIGRDSAGSPDITAADLRADPKGMRGRFVQWDVEIMSLQSADPLRVELGRDESYLLARGPGTENAILYLVVPQSLMQQARALPPLAKVHITARVRSAKSEPAGTPILDILSIGKQ